MRYQIANYGFPKETMIRELNALQVEYDRYFPDGHVVRRGRGVDLRHIKPGKYSGTSTYGIFLCCKTCGAELYGRYDDPSFLDFDDFAEAFGEKYSELSEQAWKWSKMIYNAGKAATKQYKNDCETILENPCPVCGGSLSEENFFSRGEQYLSWMKPWTLDNEKFGEILKARREADEKRAKETAATFEKTCDVYVPDAELKAPLDNDALKKYILHLIHLENNIYSLQTQLSALYVRRLENHRAIVLSKHGPAYTVRWGIKEAQAEYQRAQEAEVNQREKPVRYPAEPAAPELGKPGLFNKKKVQEENDALTAKYQAEMAAYQKEVQRLDEEKARLIAAAQKEAEEAKAALEAAERDADEKIRALEARPASANVIKEVVDKEIAETEDLLKKTFAARNELYAYGVIFGKYRNAVALSSIYEYLMAGRCTSLEGADGAYNIYESEVRANRVIAQLDTVISSLEDIKQNQYMMYEELRSINESLDSLNYTMDQALTSIRGIEANTTQMNEYMEHISQNSDVIAHNTAVSAYYSKINAPLTNALGYMMAFK